MRVVFVSQGSLQTWIEGVQEDADVVVFGFNGVGEVSYEKELKGESCFFEAGAKLSKRGKNIVVFGCVTDILGHKRKSVAVAENGKLLGVSDMLHAIDGEWSAGANVRAYETKMGRMGVIVARDLYFPETLKALSLCGCEWIVCPFDRKISSLDRSYISVYAHVYGMPILLCGDNFSMIASPKGEILFSSPYSPVSINCKEKREYHLVKTRSSRHGLE